MYILNNFKYYTSLLKSYKASKKLIVIESDDWGSERIPSLKIRNDLQTSGINIEKNPHSMFDTLERLEDLEVIDNMLTEIENLYGKKVKITTNFNVANPDYQKIATSNFEQYHFQSFTQNYYQRDKNDTVWNTFKKMIQKGYLQPQFHGREHINVNFWLEELRLKNPLYLKAFELGCNAIDAPVQQNHLNNLMAAFEYQNQNEKEFIINSIIEGLNIFEKTFLVRSKTLVPPRHVWDTDLEFEFVKSGVSHIQSSLMQLHPRKDGYKKLYHFTGKKNKATGIQYLVRNLYFEPAYSNKIDWVNKAILKIQVLFLLKIPVIISMHRINFVGGLSQENRENNCKLFKELLQKIIIKFPEVEFLSSDELGQKLKN